MFKSRSLPMSSRGRRRRMSPLMMIGISVPVVLVLIATALVVVPRLVATHAAAAAVNPNCSLKLPHNPLSAKGLATPYQLFATDAAQGPCNEANAGQSAFAQAVIFDPANNTLSAYEPLVIDQGTQPAVAPVVPTLPKNAIVGIWFGFNGTFLHLTGDTRNGRCVNGLGGSDFGQFAYCNAPRFFRAANAAIQAGKITVPPLGTDKNGKACPSTRDFAIVDMDQSDNVQTQYIATANGQTAQLSAANMGQLQNAKTIGNPSDNALVSRVLDPVLGCTAWAVNDLVNPGIMTPTMATDELQAAAFQGAPVALVPSGDEMTLINNQPNLAKVTAYRIGVDQTPATAANANTTTYCKNLMTGALPQLQGNMALFQGNPSPDGGATANSLFTFLANRLNATLGAGGLNCVGLLNVQNPITLTTDGNGVVTAATIAGAGNGNGNGGTTATTTLSVNGTAAQFANGQAQVTINQLPATATLNGAAVTITDGAANNNGGNGNGNGAGAATTPTLTVNGTAVQFTNGQAQVTINKLPATATLNGTSITITDGAANNGGNGNGGNGGGNGNGGNGGGGTTTPTTCTLNGTAIPNCTVTINGQTCTITNNATTNQVSITCAAAGGGQQGGGAQPTPTAPAGGAQATPTAPAGGTQPTPTPQGQ